MKRILFAVLLAAIGHGALARGFPEAVVMEAANCPADTAATGGPSYVWSDGRFVFEGWICEDKYRGTSVGN